MIGPETAKCDTDKNNQIQGGLENTFMIAGTGPVAKKELLPLLQSMQNHHDLGKGKNCMEGFMADKKSTQNAHALNLHCSGIALDTIWFRKVWPLTISVSVCAESYFSTLSSASLWSHNQVIFQQHSHSRRTGQHVKENSNQQLTRPQKMNVSFDGASTTQNNIIAWGETINTC